MGFLKKIGKGIGKIIGKGIEGATGLDVLPNNNRQPNINFPTRTQPQPLLPGQPKLAPSRISLPDLGRAPTPGQLGRGSQPTKTPSGSGRNGFDPFGSLIDFPAATEAVEGISGLFDQNGQQLDPDLSDLVGPNRIVIPAGQKVIADCPSGFRAVTLKDGRKVCMREKFAKKFDFISTRKKPPITASEWDKLKAAERVKKKAKKIAQTADFVCRNKK